MTMGNVNVCVGGGGGRILLEYSLGHVYDRYARTNRMGNPSSFYMTEWNYFSGKYRQPGKSPILQSGK